MIGTLIGDSSMSRKLFAFLLSELKTVRIICQSPACGSVSEMTPKVMEIMCQSGACPVCKAPFEFDGNRQVNPLVRLAMAIQELQHSAAQKKVQIELAIPESEPEAKK
jgi:hypothetical protein